jgi:hypothetical protein
MVGGSKPGGDEIFLILSDLPFGPLSVLLNGYPVSFSEVKWPGRGITIHPDLAPRLSKEYRYTAIRPLGHHGLLYGDLLLTLNTLFSSYDIMKTTKLSFNLSPTGQFGILRVLQFVLDVIEFCTRYNSFK